MIADWFTETASYSTATQGVASYTSSFMYFSTPEDGARATKGWFKVVPGYYLHEDKYNDGDDYWYYADGDGEIYSNVIKTIKGKKYAFDNYGRMIDGLVFLQMATENGKVDSSEIDQKFADDGDIPYDTEDAFDDFVVHYAPQISSGEIRSFYFGDSDDGAMKTGRQTVEIDGDSFTFKFKDSSSSKGAGINGIDDHKLYSAGKLIEADSDDKYQVVIYSEDEDGIVTMEKMDTDDFLTEYCHELEAGDKDYDEDATTWNVNEDIDSNVKLYLVNTSGSMVKNKSAAKDGEDYKFNVKNYQITQVVLED